MVYSTVYLWPERAGGVCGGVYGTIYYIPDLRELVGLVWSGNAQPIQDGPGQGDTVGHLPPAPPTITRQGQVVDIRASQRLRQPEIQLPLINLWIHLT